MLKTPVSHLISAVGLTVIFPEMVYEWEFLLQNAITSTALGEMSRDV